MQCLILCKGVGTAGQRGRSPPQYWNREGENIFSLSPSNNMPSLSAGYTQFSIAGHQEITLILRTQNAKKLLAAGASPRTLLSELIQRSPGSYLVGMGLPPLPMNLNRLSPWASSSPAPQLCWFRSDAIDFMAWYTEEQNAKFSKR